MTQNLKTENETAGLPIVRGQCPISPEMLEMDTPLSNSMGGNLVIKAKPARFKQGVITIPETIQTPCNMKRKKRPEWAAFSISRSA
jgi:hypothetical protein